MMLKSDPVTAPESAPMLAPRSAIPAARRRWRHLVGVLVFAGAPAFGAREAAPYLSPSEALGAFQIEPGLKIELVVAEPLVVDPVAFVFDENLRLYVVENRGYPDPLPASDEPNKTLGRVALLEDTDGDGRYDKRSEFATGLGYPNGIALWRGGAFVTAAPDILYLKDHDGDGVAEERRVVLTGFEDSKTAQIRAAFPTLGFDGWIYLTCGRNGGKVYSPEHPSRPPVEFSAVDGRFHPDSLLFELTGGSSQFGLTFDQFGRRFGVRNRHPVIHAVLEPRHLNRNPFLAFSDTVQMSARVQHEATVYPISESKTASYWGQKYRPKPNSASHAGTFTSACGLHLFGGTVLTPEHVGNAFTCEPAQNLVQRQVFHPDGASFRTRPPYDGREFLASTDVGFRPVFAATGPDGALYVADMYRREIDHPQYVPEQARQELNFTGPVGTGRIYRIRKEAVQRPRPMGSGTADICRALESPNAWWRTTAHRLLLERADPAANPLLDKLARSAPLAASRAQALWTLRDLGGLAPETIAVALRDRESGVREQGVLLAAESAVAGGGHREALLGMADDSAPRVRFLTALALGDLSDVRVPAALAKIAVRDGGDRWTRAAVLSGVAGRMEAFFSALDDRRQENLSHYAAVMEDLSRVFGVGAPLDSSRRVVTRMLAEDQDLGWCLPAVMNVAEGMQGRRDLGMKPGESPLGQLLRGQELEAFFSRVAALARNEGAESRARISAVTLLGQTDYGRTGALLGELIDPRQPPAIQLQAVRAFEQLGDPRGGEVLLEPEHWRSYTPQVRAAVISALTSKPALAEVLFAAIEKDDLKATDIPSVRRRQLLRHRNPGIRERARVVLAKLEGSDRMQVFQGYRDILEQPADPSAGAEPYVRVCSTCHTYNRAGGRVGPDLTGVRNQPADALLLHILVPNHEITPGYEAVSVTTRDGRTLSGWLVSESENSLTLRSAFDTQEIVARANIDEFSTSGISLMPEGLEHTMTRQELAAIIAYLRQPPAAAR